MIFTRPGSDAPWLCGLCPTPSFRDSDSAFCYLVVLPSSVTSESPLGPLHPGRPDQEARAGASWRGGRVETKPGNGGHHFFPRSVFRNSSPQPLPTARGVGRGTGRGGCGLAVHPQGSRQACRRAALSHAAQRRMDGKFLECIFSSPPHPPACDTNNTPSSSFIIRSDLYTDKDQKKSCRTELMVSRSSF